MLAGLTPGQFAEWIAYRRLEPDPVELIVEVMKLGFAAIVQTWGGKVEPSYFDPRSDRSKEETVNQTPEQTAAMFRSWMGTQ